MKRINILILNGNHENNTENNGSDSGKKYLADITIHIEYGQGVSSYDEQPGLMPRWQAWQQYHV